MRTVLTSIEYRDIEVFYAAELDGGGMSMAQPCGEFVHERFGKVGHVFEYCAGPGFIGFYLLANGLCDRLTLGDINPVAVEACRKTIEVNNLQDRVAVFQSDGLERVPKDERWDLVVGNPPHWRGQGARWENDLRLVDPDFIVHRKLFEAVGDHLNPGGRVVLIENALATRSSDFSDLIQQSGLSLVETYPPSAAQSSRFFQVRSRTALFLEIMLNQPGAEAVFKKGPIFRKFRERPREGLGNYYLMSMQA